MNKVSLTLLPLVFSLSCLVAGEAFSASRVQEICEGVLKARPFLPQDLQSEAHIPDVYQPTVAVRGSIPGQHPGGRLNILQRTGDKWQSPYEIGAAVQGDPRAVGILLGSELAHYLGFSIFDENNIQVPNAVELNRRLAQLNNRLQKIGVDPVNIAFVDSVGTISDYKFLQLFNQEFKIPIAVDGLVHVHDISSHVGVLAIPDSIPRAVQKVSQLQIRFIDFLKNRLNQVQSAEDQDFYKWLIGFSYESEAMFLDTVMGNTVVYATSVTVLKREHSFVEKNQTLQIDNDEYGANKSILVEEYTQFFGRVNRPTLRTAFDARVRRIPPGSLNSHEQILLQKDMTDFIAQNPSVDWDQSLGEFAADHVFYLIGQRIADMKKALAEAAK